MDGHASLLWYAVNIRSLETLLWITRLGSFSAAARHLRLTQPAITRRINELEQELGSALFRREKAQVVLTLSGRRCLQVAERMVADFAALKAAAAQDLGVSGTMRVGVSEVIALTWLDKLLERVGNRYPAISVELDVDLSARLVKKLAARRVDIALLPGPVVLPEAITQSLGSYPLSWMSHPNLMASDNTIEPSDLVDVPIIASPDDASVSSVMQNWFRNAGVRPRRISYCGNVSVVASLVRKGVGVSLLPPGLFKEGIEAKTMKVLSERPSISPLEYSVSYIPTSELGFLPEIALFARAISRDTEVWQ
ncbi:LysR family transcriptional regulator [Acidisoma silvae]|uniref:LysR family transcriptional regulator n=1 Tax=Acidisoma silvae TaxID=2802396 RepID=A0A963YXS6_9PROT|nr:LysR family transcriptional regulator [Acidisoma silvae]MCB8878138.1 LysR family transcriptional regulator [Acidisoma silvae]